MLLELSVIGEPLEDIVTRHEVELVSVNSLCKRHFMRGISVASDLFEQRLKPGIDELSVFVAETAQVPRNRLHVVRTEKRRIVGQSELHVVCQLIESPTLVHFGERIVAIDFGVVSTTFNNPIELKQTSSNRSAVKATSTEFVVFRKNVVNWFD